MTGDPEAQEDDMYGKKSYSQQLSEPIFEPKWSNLKIHIPY